MKKRAFTLAEALIALGVVGVVAALVLPLANKARPDEMKVSYLKTYDSLTEVVNSITHASKLYRPVLNIPIEDNKVKTFNISDYPLLDTYEVKNINGQDCGKGIEAFGKILAVGFNGKGSGNFFETKRGMQFWVKPNTEQEHLLTKDTDTTNGNITLYYEIEVDLNGKRGVNSFYDSSKPYMVPDKYRFFVLSNGSVIPADKYGQMYVSTRNNWKKLNNEMIQDKLGRLEEITADNIGNFKPEVIIADLNPTIGDYIVDSGNDGGDDGEKDNGFIDFPTFDGVIDLPGREKDDGKDNDNNNDNNDDGYNVEKYDPNKPKDPGIGLNPPEAPDDGQDGGYTVEDIYKDVDDNIRDEADHIDGVDNDNDNRFANNGDNINDVYANDNNGNGGAANGDASSFTPPATEGPAADGPAADGPAFDGGGGERESIKFTSYCDPKTGEFSDTLFWGSDGNLYACDSSNNCTLAKKF